MFAGIGDNSLFSVVSGELSKLVETVPPIKTLRSARPLIRILGLAVFPITPTKPYLARLSS